MEVMVRNSIEFKKNFLKNNLENGFECKECGSKEFMYQDGFEVCTQCGLISDEKEKDISLYTKPKYQNDRYILLKQSNTEQVNRYRLLLHKPIAKFGIEDKAYISKLIEIFDVKLLIINQSMVDNLYFYQKKIPSQFFIRQIKENDIAFHYSEFVYTLFYFLYAKKVLDLKVYIEFVREHGRFITRGRIHDIKVLLEKNPVFSSVFYQNIKDKNEFKGQYFLKIQNQLKQYILVMDLKQLKRKILNSINLKDEFFIINYKNKLYNEVWCYLQKYPYEQLSKYLIKSVCATALWNVLYQYFYKNYIASVCQISEATTNSVNEKLFLK